MNQIIEKEKKLKEAVIYLIKVANEYKTYGDLDNPTFEDIKKIPESIETVLKELEKLQQKEKSKIIGNIYEIKIEDLELVLKPYYIPKKKIKEKIEELEENGYWHFLENRDLELTQKILQELLEEK